MIMKQKTLQQQQQQNSQGDKIAWECTSVWKAGMALVSGISIILQKYM